MKVTPSVPNLAVTRLGQFEKSDITGDFTYDQEYLLQIAEVPVNNGQAMLEERSLSFEGPGIKPEVAVSTNRSVVRTEREAASSTDAC